MGAKPNCGSQRGFMVGLRGILRQDCSSWHGGSIRLWLDLHNDNWTRRLWRMTNADQMAELIELWFLIQDVQLGQSEDEIMWSWTANGAYSAKSAYKVQFRGSYCTYNCSAIWKAKAEGKHRVFAWLLIQNKILTADDLMIRNLPCNPICTLCDQAKETAGHLCLHCVYAREVWDHVSRWTNGLVSVPASFKGLDHRWGFLFETDTEGAKASGSCFIYIAWNLWKERNRRTFDHWATSPGRVLV